jgi:hypothetical protein
VTCNGEFKLNYDELNGNEFISICLTKYVSGPVAALVVMKSPGVVGVVIENEEFEVPMCDFTDQAMSIFEMDPRDLTKRLNMFFKYHAG